MTQVEPDARIHRLGSVMRVDAVTADVVGRARAAGVRVILLKGPSLGRWLYDDKSERPYSDTDLLVGPAQADDLARVLGELGFEVAVPRHDLDRPVPAVNWIRRRGGSSVDVHVGITGAGVSSEEQWAILSAGTERMTVGGVEVEVLSQPGRVLHAVLHLAQDGRGGRALRDVDRAVERVPMETWRSAAVLAERLRAVPAFAGGLRLSEKGAGLAERLGLPSERSVEVILREDPAPLALGLKWLGEMPGVRDRARLVWAKLFPPPHEIVPDPRRRTPAVVVAAYARNLLRLTRQMVPAWRALRRARRVAAQEAASERPPNRGQSPKPDAAARPNDDEP